MARKFGRRFFFASIKKLVTRNDNCLNVNGNYVKKLKISSGIKLIFLSHFSNSICTRGNDFFKTPGRNILKMFYVFSTG